MLVAAAVALVLGLALQPPALRLLRARRVLDVPSERSSHASPTLRGGGLAVVLALVLAVLVVEGVDLGGEPGAWPVLACVLLCCALGAAEDLRGVPVLPRFVLMLVAVAPLVAVPEVSAGLLLAVVGPAAVLFAVAVVNAVNFMDGINGISCAQGLVGGVAYALLAAHEGLGVASAIAAATAGAFLSFAPFNVPHARAFLGDSGSYALGGALAGLSVLLLARGVPPEAVLGPLALYLADTGSTLVRRWRAGEPWHLPHRTHVYQRLTDLGLSHAVVSGLVLGLTACCSAAGAVSLVGGLLRPVADLGLAAVVIGYLALPVVLRSRVPVGHGSSRCAT